MHLKFKNVNEAFQSIIEGIDDRSIPTIKTPSRNGPVLQIPEPLIITYTHPRERVLFNRERDCNPFFHLYESLWMLAGRNDVAPLDYYMGGKYSQFSDDGVTANGAYGYRWRHASNYVWDQGETFGSKYVGNGFEPTEIDQLKILIAHLKAKPESRRAVLQMWNVEDDLLKMDTSKDICCNLSVMFSIRHDVTPFGCAVQVFPKSYLDITVTNRSNDLIWGLLGANQVHFGFLQEYVACALGIEVGHYHQMTNNAHVYTETNSGWHPDEWLKEYRTRTMHSPLAYRYGREGLKISRMLFNLAETVEHFDGECSAFVDINKNGEEVTQETNWSGSFLNLIAQPMMHAFHLYKQKDFSAALEWCELIMSDDWRIASRMWIEKRHENFKKKKEASNAD